MSKCIFCKSSDNSFLRVEHLIPESLGGDIIMPANLVCDKCNNYFGRKVERQALNAPIISFMRALLGTQNKRSKFHYHEGMNWGVQGGKSEKLFLFPEQKIEYLMRTGTGTGQIICP
ncbi:MAG: HNH endonuclease, partial [Chloroflexota bacterium]